MLVVLSSRLLLIVESSAFELDCSSGNLGLSFLLGDSTEDDIHRLQRNTGSLREQQGETERNYVDSGEEEELRHIVSLEINHKIYIATYDTTFGHVNDHERSSLGNRKVPEPLGGSGSHETVVASAVVEDCSSSS